MIVRLAAAVAVLALAAPATANAASRLRIIDLHSGRITAETSGRSWSQLTWRPDGSLVATTRDRSLRALPGGEIATVTGAFATTMSPAGDRLATVVPAGRDERLEIRTLTGTVLGRHRIRGSRTSLAWTRDGTRLALAWMDSKLGDHITILGSRGQRLRTFPAPAEVEFSSAAWSPDGRSLSYVTRPGGTLIGDPAPREIRRLDVMTGTQTVLLRGTRCEAAPFSVCELLDAPQIGPDGARVTLVRDLNAVALLSPPALPAQLTPSPQCDGVFDVAWAPDGGSLLVAYVEGDDMLLAQVPASPLGGVTRVVANLGHTDVEHLTVSPDGTRAAFSGTSDIDF